MRSRSGMRTRHSAFRIPHSAFALLALVLATGAALWPGEAAIAEEDGWWNPAWTHRKRVRVRLAPEEPLGFRYRAPAAGPDDLVAAEARFFCELKLKAPAQQEVRVLDAGGNVLPCTAEAAETPGILTVTFPARRTIAGQLAAPIQDGTKSVALNVGRNKAVRPGTRFYALAGAIRIATLEVEAVEATSSVARVLDKTTPNIAQGIPVESEVLASAEYSIYYGNPKAAGEAPRWSPAVAPITLTGWRITDGQFLSQLEVSRGTYRLIPPEQLAAVMRASPTYVGTQSLTLINTPGNPLGYDSDFHVSIYEAYFYCDPPGLYRFSVDSSAPAYLFINGKLVAQRPAFFYQVAGNFEHRGKIELEEGYHHLLLAAVESGRLCNTRLGWQPITATVISPVPASFYRTRIRAEVVGFETRDDRRQVAFTYKLAPLSVLAESGKRFQFVHFQNLTPQDEDEEGTTYRWDFGDAGQSTEQSPGHLFEVPPEDAVVSFPVTLQATRRGKVLGTYTQPVLCEPRPAERLNLSLDIVSFANIVYHDERTSIAVRLRNTAFSPVVVRAIARLDTPDGPQIVVNQPLLIEGKNENFCIIPVDMKQLGDKPASVQLDVRLGEQRVLDAAARIIPFNALARPGAVRATGGELLLGPGGALSGVAWEGDFPASNYELALRLQRRAGRGPCYITFPVGDALCTLRPQNGDMPLEAGRWHDLRLRVTDARVDAWLDGRSLAAVRRAAAQSAFPLAHETLTSLGLHATLDTQVAVRDIKLGRLEAPAPAEAPPEPKAAPEPPRTASYPRRRPRGALEPPIKAPQPPPPLPPLAPGDGPQPANWQALFDGSLKGWKAVTESDLNLLRRGLGALYDHEGRRVMLSTEIEDADRHLEWVFARWAHERFIASRKSVLVFGDRMAIPTLPEKPFADYIGLLEARLKKAGRPLQFVERSTGLLPTLPDVVLFARTLQVLRPLPDFIVISPGLADVQQAVGDRDFVRSFDLMIDAVRATGKSIKLIIVSPPPCPRNIQVSRLYTEALEKLARQHHVTFLNLDSLFTAGQADWLRAAFAAPDAEGIFLDSPNEAAHRRIADAIEKLLER